MNQQDPKRWRIDTSLVVEAYDTVRLSIQPGECRYSRTSVEPIDAPVNFYLRAWLWVKLWSSCQACQGQKLSVRSGCIYLQYHSACVTGEFQGQFTTPEANKFLIKEISPSHLLTLVIPSHIHKNHLLAFQSHDFSVPVAMYGTEFLASLHNANFGWT